MASRRPLWLPELRLEGIISPVDQGEEPRGQWGNGQVEKVEWIEGSEDNSQTEGEIFGVNFDIELFQQGRSRRKMSRKERCEERQRFGLVKAKDQPQKKRNTMGNEFNVNHTDLQKMQETNKTLAAMRAGADGEPRLEMCSVLEKGDPLSEMEVSWAKR